jgi:hypothetical protein
VLNARHQPENCREIDCNRRLRLAQPIKHSTPKFEKAQIYARNEHVASEDLSDRFWRASDHRRDAGGRRLKLDLLGDI